MGQRFMLGLISVPLSCTSTTQICNLWFTTNPLRYNPTKMTQSLLVLPRTQYTIGC